MPGSWHDNCSSPGMKKYASGIRPSELSLVEEPPSSDDTSTVGPAPQSTGAAGVSDSRRANAETSPSTPKHAVRPSELGLVEASPPSAAAYADARATSANLRNTAGGAAKGERRSERPSRPDYAARGTTIPKVSRHSRDEAPEEATAPTPQHRPRLGRKHLIWAGGLLGSLAVAAAVVAMQSQRDPEQPRSVARAASPVAAMPGPPTPSSPKDSVAATAGGTLPEEFTTQFQALKSARNWNVIVLYAAEWTRKQPANPEPWKELSRGYYQLRQYGDALDAATKVVELAPADSLGWQTLGQINLSVRRYAQALDAFERAAAINDHDLISLVQAGILNSQLGRLPDARIAFAKALAVNPEDTDALCGGASIAHREGRARDAEVMMRQLKSLNAHCGDASAVESVHVPVSVVARNQSESSSVR